MYINLELGWAENMKTYQGGTQNTENKGFYSEGSLSGF